MRRVCQWGRPSVGKAERRGETPFHLPVQTRYKGASEGPPRNTSPLCMLLDQELNRRAGKLDLRGPWGSLGR